MNKESFSCPGNTHFILQKEIKSLKVFAGFSAIMFQHTGKRIIPEQNKPFGCGVNLFQSINSLTQVILKLCQSCKGIA